MYWQRRYLEEHRSFPDMSGLYTIDLPNKGLLSGIELYVAALGSDDQVWSNLWIHDCLEKIELIINGSFVVKSLTGSQLQALTMYDGTWVDGIGNRSYGNTTSYERFYINLGRFFHDEEYMLDLSKVNDPEIRITYNFELASSNGWGEGAAFMSDTMPWFSCLPHLVKDAAITPKGYIKTTEAYRFTSAALRQENMTIPRGPIYNGLYLESRYKWEGLGRLLDHIEVNINSSDTVPFRLASADLMTEIQRRYGRWKVSQLVKPVTTSEYCPPLESAELWESNYNNSDVIGCHGPVWGGYCNIASEKISDYTAQAAELIRWFHFEGMLPHNVAKLPYMDPMKPETWVDSGPLGDFWVRVEENDVDATNAVLKLLTDEVITSYA